MANESKHVLKVLNEIAAKEVDLAMEALARAMKVSSEAKAKHEMLVQYRQDYLNHLNSTLASGMNTKDYQNFRNFLAKLDQALAGQMDVVHKAEEQVEISRGLWQESQRKKLSYEVLTVRSDKRTAQAAEKRDQKVTDEHATRIARVKR